MLLKIDLLKYLTTDVLVAHLNSLGYRKAAHTHKKKEKKGGGGEAAALPEKLPCLMFLSEKMDLRKYLVEKRTHVSNYSSEESDSEKHEEESSLADDIALPPAKRKRPCSEKKKQYKANLSYKKAWEESASAAAQEVAKRKEKNRDIILKLLRSMVLHQQPQSYLISI